MIWLNAGLAFTLAMIVFCTMVTAITEAVHHFFNMRQRGLEAMLAELFEKVIWPRLEGSLNADKNSIKKDYLETLTSNPAVAQHDGCLSTLRLWFAPRQLSSLNLTQFAENLADTELGKELWKSGKLYATEVVDDVARRFKRFEEGATAYFAQRAQMMSLMIAIMLAFALNVDAIRLFKAFLTDQQMTARVLAHAEEITGTYNKQSTEQAKSVSVPEPTAAAPAPQPPPAELAPELTSAAAPEGKPEAPEPQTAAEKQAAGDNPLPSTTQPASAGNANAAGDSDIKAIEEQAAFVRRQIDASTALGLPIGNTYYPWCLDDIPGPTCNDPLTWERFGKASITSQSVSRFVRWLVSVLLAGVLIGLGGPFWFSTFSSLSSLVQFLGGPEKQTKGDSAESASATAPQTVEAAKSQTPGEIFSTLANAAAPKPPQGRILLTPRGTPR